MDARTEGAWIIQHTKKLRGVENIPDFDDIQLAGKCGLFLSSLAATEEESVLKKDKTEAIADSLNISKKLELPSIIRTLKDAKLIDESSTGELRVLGITTSNVLVHTSQIFVQSLQNNYQKAAIELTNHCSDKPIRERDLKEYIGDTFHLTSQVNDKLFQQSEDVGFIDYEATDKSKTYFNGNLFKRQEIEKATRVIESLSTDDAKKITQADELLSREGCISFELAHKIMGGDLISKLQAIGMYDFNEVSNNIHTKVFLTKPSAFAKYGNPFEEDAFDMAKAFISSLIYGMKISPTKRGRIRDYSMLRNTLKKLLRGERIGPCTAIGYDYQILEVNRVVQLERGPGSMYYMRLLKYDIGRLALEVLDKGDLAEQTTLELNISSTSISRYSGPEENRWKVRRKRNISNAINVGELIRTMRT